MHDKQTVNPSINQSIHYCTHSAGSLRDRRQIGGRSPIVALPSRAAPTVRKDILGVINNIILRPTPYHDYGHDSTRELLAWRSAHRRADHVAVSSCTDVVPCILRFHSLVTWWSL